VGRPQHARRCRRETRSDRARALRQVWIAISAYVLVAIVKKRLAVQASLYTILPVLSLTFFEKTPLIQLVNNSVVSPAEDDIAMQPNLFT
jgi:hypothetical protein